jgi:transposase InsO family protein
VVTEPDRYPLPSLADFANKLHGCRYFSVIDLVKGYHQIPMAAEDIAKTAIVTPFGMFEYLYMPFGLKNAAQTFQRLMDKIFSHLPFLFTYLDDHLIASRTLEEHHRHLRQFFELLQANGLQINPEKCVFAATEVDFLGHRVTADGIAPLRKPVDALLQLPMPEDVKQLQRFLGLINFYRRFLPGIAGTLKPLTDALRGNSRHLEVSEDMKSAVAAAKAALASATLLAHPAPAATLSLVTDASDSHIRGVLQQLEGRHWRPLVFFSQKLTPPQVKYSTFNRELTAIFSAVRHFRFLLEGRHFRILTDHKPVVAAFRRVSPPWSARQQRQLSYVAEFTSDIRHTPGAGNFVADALSRPTATVSAASPPLAAASSSPHVDPSLPAPILPSPPSVDDWPAASVDSLCPVEVAQPPSPSAIGDLEAFSAAQKTCPDVAAMRQSPSLDIVYRLCGKSYLYSDVSTPVFRPLVPRDFCRAVFEALHNDAHPGRRATKRLILSRFVWPKLAQLVTQWARECIQCQRAKTHRHVQPTPTPIPVPANRFSHVNIDIVGPLPSSSGYTHLLTVMDRCSRWPEALPLSSTTSAACAFAFIAGWISRFGVPSSITSDRGPQFTSSLWSAVCTQLGVSHTLTPAYHPQANGVVERFHRRLKDGLRAREAGSDWYLHLPWVLLGIRTATADASSPSPAETLYGSQLVLPGQLVAVEDSPVAAQFLDSLKRMVDEQRPAAVRHNLPSTATAASALPPALLHARMVFVRRDKAKPPLTPAYAGPYEVLERSSSFFKLQIGDRTDIVTTARLKAAELPATALPAVPRRRGRPPLRPQSPAPASAARVRRHRRVTFVLPPAVPAPSSGRPVRHRRPPTRFSLSAIGFKTGGEM